MTQVKTNSTQTQLSTSKIHPSLLSRHEVIWIQCFHWPNVTTWAYKAQAQEKRKILTLVLISASGPFSRWNKNYCVFRLVFVSRMKANKRKQLSFLISFYKKTLLYSKFTKRFPLSPSVVFIQDLNRILDGSRIFQGEGEGAVTWRWL